MLNQILDLTKQLISIPSVTSDKTRTLEVLQLAQRHLPNYAFIPFASDGIPSVLYSNTGQERKDFKIILNAHLDVVPGGNNQYSPYVENGKLYGRGAYDMKAAAAVMIILFNEIGHTLPYALGLQLVTDEEMGGFHGTNYQIHQGVQTEFAITGDCGSNLAITNQAKGIMWVKLEAKGAAAHSGYLWRGENALWNLHIALNKLQEAFPIPKDPEWVTTMNLAKIETENTTLNYVPIDAAAYLDFRFIEEEEEHLIQKIRAIIPENVQAEVMVSHPPDHVSVDNSYLKLLQTSGKAATGRDIGLNQSHAQSDIRFFNGAGYTGVEFGPIGDHQHGENEWVDIASIEEYYKIIHRFLSQLV